MLGFDWRDNATHPRRGGHYEVTASRFDGRRRRAHDFRRIDVHLQQIVPLGNRYRRLELRAQAALTDADGNARVPMIYSRRSAACRPCAASATSRFRDRNAVSMSAEYQWEAWWALDAAVFVDAGPGHAPARAISTTRSLRDDLRHRLSPSQQQRVPGRLDLAYSREGFVPLLGFKYGF